MASIAVQAFSKAVTERQMESSRCSRSNLMSASEQHSILQEIVSHFETLGMRIEHAIDVFAQDDSGSVNLAALHRAKDAAQRGASLARDATSDLRRAFD